MARENLLRAAQRKTIFAPSGLGGTVERLLLQLPMFLMPAFGLIFIGYRFVALLREDLKEVPDSLASVALLVVMIGSVAVFVTLICTAAGAIIGLTLRACLGKRLHHAFSRHSSASVG